MSMPDTFHPDLVHTPSALHDRNRPSQGAGLRIRPDSPAPIDIGPHEGYRRYFRSPLGPADIDRLFPDTAVSANFPAVRYAAGWAYADYATQTPTLDLEEREHYIATAEATWQEALRLVDQTYELLPGRFLLWPCTKWRYKFALDTAPTLHAIALAQTTHARQYDQDLLRESMHRTGETVRVLFDKYQAVLEAQAAEVDRVRERPSVYSGRLGSIIGVALEGVALYDAQQASGAHYAVLPPSLKLDSAGDNGTDLTAQATRGVIFSGQIKKHVTSKDRRKYRSVALICAKHHMKEANTSLIHTIEAVADRRADETTQKVGSVVLKVMQGSRAYGCSRFNPRPVHRFTPRFGSKAA